jgi:hypothetical protein
MRKTLIITLVLCVAATFAYAQTTGTTGSTTSSTTTSTTGTTGGTTTTTTTKKHSAAHHMYKGTVASVDSASSSFVVHPAKGADMTLKVNDKTKYSPKGKAWADVTVGAKVSGGYHNDGTDNWALTVKIWPADTGTAAKTGTK